MLGLLLGVCVLAWWRGQWLLQRGRKSGWWFVLLVYALPLSLVAAVVADYLWYLLSG